MKGLPFLSKMVYKRDTKIRQNQSTLTAEGHVFLLIKTPLVIRMTFVLECYTELTARNKAYFIFCGSQHVHVCSYNKYGISGD